MPKQAKKINTIFIGTSDFSISGLQSLLDDDFFNIGLVISQKDKKIGRKHVLTETPVKKLAKKYHIPILQPSKITDVYDEIKKQKPDLIIVVAYGQILTKKILDLPKYGCINVHASLLPKYRGSSCIQAALINQDAETGISIIKMDEGLDTGPIIHQEKIKIQKNDTAGILFEKLSNLTYNILSKILKEYINGNLKLKNQNNKKASFVGILKKNDGKINWNEKASKIEASIRAMSPWPSSFSFLGDVKIKIIKTGDILKINEYKTGQLFIKNNILAVQCASNALQIKELQISGKRAVKAKDFVHGYARYIGKKFD